MKSLRTLLKPAVVLVLAMSGIAAAPDLDAIRDKLPEKVTPVSKEDLIAKIPSFFYFDYDHEPLPGKRLWLRISPDKWLERYPDGTESTFAVLGHAQVGDITGTILVKVAGDQAKTDTDNDGKFQAFVPDKNNEVNHFLYRNAGRGDVQWSDLGEMKGVE